MKIKFIVNIKKYYNKKKKKTKDGKIGKSILYKGENYTINNVKHEKDVISIRIDEKNKIFKIFLPIQMKKEEEDYWIQKTIRKLFKDNTEAIIATKLPYWSNVTKIKYKSVKVRDAKTRYGSCATKTKDLHFSSRLVMLPQYAIDAVIVHELCHIVHPNHSKQFYDLVKKYIPNYEEIDKYLKKEAGKEIDF